MMTIYPYYPIRVCTGVYPLAVCRLGDVTSIKWQHSYSGLLVAFLHSGKKWRCVECSKLQPLKVCITLLEFSHAAINSVSHYNNVTGSAEVIIQLNL